MGDTLYFLRRHTVFLILNITEITKFARGSIHSYMIDFYLKSCNADPYYKIALSGRSLRIRAMTKSPAFSEVWILRTEKNV
jgi:hypothetical protein